jgi:hypothetical protein
MKLTIIALALASTAAVAQQAQAPLYNPANGPLPNDRRYVMTREGAEAAQYEAQHPLKVIAQPAPAPVPRSYALPERASAPQPSAPEWFVRLPQDTVDMVFAAGTATSTDEQMAYDKARMAAERKLVEMTNSRIQTQTKSYRADRGDTSIENYEQVTRKNANGELTGAQRVDSQAVFDGRTYKVYVLLRLPVGEANTVAKSRASAQLQREADIRSRAAHQELDRTVNEERKQEAQRDEKLKQEIEPKPVASTTVPVVGGELKLMDVDNEEYKQRRAEALAKPGAVIGQTVVR